MGYGDTADGEEASFHKAMGIISKTCAKQGILLVTGTARPAGARCASRRGGGGGDFALTTTFKAASRHEALHIFAVTLRAHNVVVAAQNQAFEFVFAFLTLIFVDGHFAVTPFHFFDLCKQNSRRFITQELRLPRMREGET
jgi:hypothetical protein